jgi:hypothetical protein
MSDTANPTEGATGLAGAADFFASAMDDNLTLPEGSVTPKPKQNAAGNTSENEVDPAVLAAAAAQEDEAGEGEPQHHETNSEDDAPDGEGDGSEEGDEEQPAADEEAETDPEKLPTHVTVTIDGKPVQVPLDEAVKGYQRQADYSRKTQALAEERKAHESVVAKLTEEETQVKTERAQYSQLLNLLANRLQELEPQEPDWTALYARDKTEFLVARDQWQQFQAQKAEIAKEQERVKGLQTVDERKAHNGRVIEGRKALMTFNPKWADETVRQADFAKLRQYATDTLGYTQNELEQAADHRQVIASYKAMKYDELMAKAKSLKPTSKGTPKTAPAGGAARTAPLQPEVKSTKSAMRRLAQTGHERDAAAVFEQLLF